MPELFPQFLEIGMGHILGGPLAISLLRIFAFKSEVIVHDYLTDRHFPQKVLLRRPRIKKGHPDEQGAKVNFSVTLALAQFFPYDFTPS
jgi:hypothetical protein